MQFGETKIHDVYSNQSAVAFRFKKVQLIAGVHGLDPVDHGNESKEITRNIWSSKVSTAGRIFFYLEFNVLKY